MADEPRHDERDAAGRPRRPVLGRRTLLKGLGAAAVATGMPVGATAATDALGPELIQPAVVSVDRGTGVLDVALEVRYGYNLLDGRPVALRSYDGLLTGRTLRLRAGDTLRVHLSNRLPPEPVPPVVASRASAHHGHGDPAPNVPHGFNLTNLHTHGLHVSPRPPADAVLLTVAPGQSYQYVIPIGADHPCGTYFYHPHRHGSVALQVASGMAGALIVEGKVEALTGIAPEQERVMLFQSLPVDAQGQCESYATLGRDGALVYVNGQRRPTVTFRPGEVQMWRLVNASHDRFLDLSLAGHRMTLLGVDGDPLRHTEEVERVSLAPGNRADVLVRAGEPGVYSLQGGGPYGVVAAMRVAGERLDPAPRLYSGPLADYERDFGGLLRPIADAEVVNGRRIAFDMVGTWPYRTFTVDGKPFGPEDAILAKLDTAEEWVVVNQTAEPHPFHIHVNSMQVIEAAGVPAGRWVDTLVVPPAGKVRFRTRFEDFDGTFVLHCHTLVHEDQGMMRLVTVEA